MAKVSMPVQLFPARFEVQNRLGEGGMGIVYEVLDHDTNTHLAAKTLRKMAPEHLYWLKNEFRRLADVQHPNLVQLGELYSDATQCFFTMEFVKGHDFRSHVRGKERTSKVEGEDDATSTMSVAGPDSYFTQAGVEVDASAVVVSTDRRGAAHFDETKLRDSLRQLAEAVVALHEHGLVHRDLKPSNVMVEPSGRVVVLDFGLTDTLRRSDNENGDGVYGTAAYMPPEQAQRAAVDEASDWYAFGVMLFNALTGRLPFEGPQNYVIKAKQEVDAPRPSALIEGCPQDLDDLCASLLARDPKARPSGSDVLTVLSRRSGEATSAAARGREPAVDVFVGRAEEIQRLDTALETAAQGRFAAILLEGEPGVGKTEIVEHFLARNKERGRSFTALRGRCYEQEFVPFKGVDAVIDSLSRHLKLLDDAKAATLLPPRFNLVAALFPVLYRVPAVAASVPPLAVNESKPEQWAEAIEQLGQLLRALAVESPLVVFIDDLQWAGADSSLLLRELCGGALPPPMLLIATCRTTNRWERDETSAKAETKPPIDPLMQSLFERMRVSYLTQAESLTLLRRLRPQASSADEEQRLSHLLAEAAGHPLFLQELSRYVGVGELPRELRLDRVLRERITKLDGSARKMLEVSAIAGVPLPARVLARVCDVSRADSVTALRLLRAEQLIRTDSGGEGSRAVETYHDRVREAVVEGLKDGSYTSTLPFGAAGTHLELARQLERSRVEDDLSVASTALANHFNLGIEAIASESDFAEAARANLEAARTTKLATAYAAAGHYLEYGRRHAQKLSSSSRKERERAIDLIDMEVSYLAQDDERGRRVFERLVANSANPIELAQAYEARIMVETAKNQLAQAVATAREGLARLSLAFPAKGNDLLLLRDMAVFELRLYGRDPRIMMDLPVTNDERIRGQMQILMAMTPAAFFSDPTLMSIAMIRMATISLTAGLTDLSAYGCIGYALVLAAGFQQYPRAFRFSTVAKLLNDRFQNRALDAKIAHLHHFNVGIYSMGFDEAKRGLKRAQELGLANGDLNFRTYGGVCTPMLTLTAGQELSVMKAECLEGVRVAEQEGNVDMAGQTYWRLRAIRCLVGENQDALRLDDAHSTEQEFLEETERAALPTTNFAYGLMQAVLGCHFGDARLALRGAERARKYELAQFGLVTLIDLALYQTLAACSVIEQGDPRDDAKQLLGVARGNLKKLAKWAAARPENFAGQSLLAKAEVLRVTDQHRKAKNGFQDALEYAERYGHHNLAALAHERVALMHGADEQRAALGRAIDAYRRWGAEGCAKRLAQRLGQQVPAGSKEPVP